MPHLLPHFSSAEGLSVVVVVVVVDVVRGGVVRSLYTELKDGILKNKNLLYLVFLIKLFDYKAMILLAYSYRVIFLLIISLFKAYI